MIRRIALVTVVTFLAVTYAAAAKEVTIVLKNGERQSGQLVYKHTADMFLNINGTERTFPISGIALIQFVPGDPPTSELAGLPEGNDPPDLDKNTLALKSGETLRGKFHDVVGDNMSFDVKNPGGAPTRRQISLDDIARLYLNAAASRDVFNFKPGSASTPSAGGSERTVTVAATQPWFDTGIDVNQGDKVSFTTEDKIQVGPGIEVGGDGSGTLKRNSYPVKEMGAGGLIFRIGTARRGFGGGGNSRAFPIGSHARDIVMPASGRLWLGVNDDQFADNKGAFNVKITVNK